MDFTGSRRRELEKQILGRSYVDTIRVDWEATEESLWQAIAEYEKQQNKESVSE